MEALALTRQALHVLAPFLVEGAATNAGVSALVAQAWNLLQRGTCGNPAAEVALAIFQTEPDDQRNLERLAQHLEDYLQQHHQALDDLRTIVAQLQSSAGQAPDLAHSNEGQQVGINTGMLNQHNQTIHNNAPNQGAQGTFHAPVNIGSVDARKADFSGAQGVTIIGVKRGGEEA